MSDASQSDPSTARLGNGPSPHGFVDIREAKVEDDAQEIPLASVVIVRAVARAIAELGYKGELRELSGLDLESAHPALGIPRRVLGRLLERVAGELGDEALGLSIGNAVTTGDFHIASLLVMNGVSTRQGIESFLMLRRSLLGGPAWTLREDGPYARLGHPMGTDLGARIEAEFGITVAYRFTVDFWGPSVEDLLQARLAFPAPDSVQRYRATFGPRVTFEASANELVFPRSLLDLRRPQADDQLASALQKLVSEQYGQGSVPRTWASRVREKIAATDCLAGLTAIELAEKLQTSSRSLRRHLAAERTSFQQLLDAARVERARRLLSDPNVHVDEVAAQLGYLSSHSFRRAYKSITGVSPTAHRRDPSP